MSRSPELHAIHTIASLRADHGGPARSVTALAAALSHRDVEVDIVALAQRAGEEPPVRSPSASVGVHLCAGDNTIRALLAGNPQYEQAIRSMGKPTGSRRVILHDHGVWLPTNHRVALVARNSNLPRIVSPRGMLSRWALDFQRLKKRIAWYLYQHGDLRSATLVHVTSEEEAAEVRALGLRQPIAVLPNGVDLPTEAAPLEAASRDPRYALFLSRVHPKKGLVNLVLAWARVRPVGWRLIIAGPDENGHRDEVEQLARREGVREHIEFVGSVNDTQKWELYSRAGLFVLPTFSENFGIVIAEALASGLPVITTVGAPWRILQQEHCGWWIDIGSEPLAVALQQATSLEPELLREMGRRGRSYVQRELSWERIATEMRNVYSYLVNDTATPSCVLTT